MILPDTLQEVNEETFAGCTRPLPAGPACRWAAEVRSSQNHSMASVLASCFIHTRQDPHQVQVSIFSTIL